MCLIFCVHAARPAECSRWIMITLCDAPTSLHTPSPSQSVPRLCFLLNKVHVLLMVLLIGEGKMLGRRSSISRPFVQPLFFWFLDILCWLIIVMLKVRKTKTSWQLNSRSSHCSGNWCLWIDNRCVRADENDLVCGTNGSVTNGEM